MIGPGRPHDDRNWTEEAFAFWQGEMYRHEIPALQWRVDEQAKKNWVNYRMPDELSDPETGAGVMIFAYGSAPRRILDGTRTFEQMLDGRREHLERTRALVMDSAPSATLGLEDLLEVVRTRAGGSRCSCPTPTGPASTTTRSTPRPSPSQGVSPASRPRPSLTPTVSTSPRPTRPRTTSAVLSSGTRSRRAI